MTAKMKKLLALLLALVMVFALAACGGDTNNYDDDDEDDDDEKTSQTDEKKDDEEKEEEEETDEDLIVGEWAITRDVSEFFNEILAVSSGMEDLGSKKSLDLIIWMEFTDDGEFTMAAEMDEDSLDEYMEDLGETALELMYEVAEEAGMDKASFDEQFETQYEMTLEEYIEELLATSTEAMLEGFEDSYIEGYYRMDVEEGIIYVAEDEDDLEDTDQTMEYKLKGDELTVKDLLTDGESAGDLYAEFGMELPWEMERQ